MLMPKPCSGGFNGPCTDITDQDRHLGKGSLNTGICLTLHISATRVFK